MIGPVFVDTNVIVYRFNTTDPRKQSRAVDWFTLLWNRRSGRVSFQVLQEAYAVLTRKMKPAMVAADAQRIVRGLAAFKPDPGIVGEAGVRTRRAHGGRTPKAPDLFAGGSAIPLEAARLGCESHALDASYRTPRMNEGSEGQAGCA